MLATRRALSLAFEMGMARARNAKDSIRRLVETGVRHFRLRPVPFEIDSGLIELSCIDAAL